MATSSGGSKDDAHRLEVYATLPQGPAVPATLTPTQLSIDVSPPVIRVRRLNHYYGTGEFRKQALFDVDLTVMPGEIAIMTGPSGCGKTTLLTLVGALRKVQEGLLEVFGEDLSKVGDGGLVDLRRDVGFIFQAHNLFGSLSALENVRMAVELRKLPGAEATNRAQLMLDHLGLADRVHYKPGRLSGGQRQRVAIARALVNRPKLILADEPTAALDEKSGHVVMGLLKQFAKEHKTAIIVVTHDQRVLDAADRIVSMSFGRIVSNVLKEERTIICEFLTRVETFKSLSPATIAEIADKMTLERFAAGSTLFKQGDPGERFYVIRRGEADVLIGQSDESIVRRTLSEGDSFGEIALLKDVPRTAAVMALTELDVYSLDKAAFKQAVEHSATFKEQLWKIYFQRQ